MCKNWSKLRKHRIFTYISHNCSNTLCFWTIVQTMRKFTCILENPGESPGEQDQAALEADRLALEASLLPSGPPGFSMEPPSVENPKEFSRKSTFLQKHRVFEQFSKPCGNLHISCTFDHLFDIFCIRNTYFLDRELEKQVKHCILFFVFLVHSIKN